jgi:hypothetical protein
MWNSRKPSAPRRVGARAALALTAAGMVGLSAAAIGTGLPGRSVHAAAAQTPAVMNLPTNVILFPAEISGAGENPSRQILEAQEIVTDAVRRQMLKQGVGLTVYSRRLPSVQRAVSEGLKAEEAVNPGDDVRKAQRLAELVGSTEFVTVSVDDYKYDPATRTATFSLSVFRNATVDGAPLGTVSEKATGNAPEDVAAPRQEGAAVARAAEVVAEQVAAALYPMPKVATPVKSRGRGR